MHKTVMQHEAIEALRLSSESVVVDATLGSGGHTISILKTLERDGVLIALDADESAIEDAKGRLQGAATIILECTNFRRLGDILKKHGIEKVDGVLADLGWRIEQFEESGKGFSFNANEPLLMTYGEPSSYPFTARDIVNEWDENVLRNIFKGYGEERYAGRIAKKIVDQRSETPIETAKELADIITSAVPPKSRSGKVHPATRSFQALRIAVNDELEALKEFLKVGAAALAPQGRLVIITFHSLEDRIVKHTFRSFETEGIGSVVTKKPLLPSEEEIADNPRSRSAKLRVFEKAE